MRVIILVPLLGAGCANINSEAENQCGPYLGQVGSKWTYSFPDNEAQGQVVEFSDFDAASGSATFITTSTYHDASLDSTDVETENLSCEADGVFITGSSTEGTGTNAYGSSTSSYVHTYDQPALILPADLAEGSAWQATVSYVSKSASGDSTQISYVVSAKATASEVVATPADTFDALAIRYTQDTDEYEEWRAEGVGLVQTAGWAGSKVLTAIE